MVFAPFRSGTGVDHSLPIFVWNRVWSTRATGVYGRICRFNSKWMKKKEEYANPKWMLGNLFVWVRVWKWWLNFYPYQIWKRNWIQEAWSESRSTEKEEEYWGVRTGVFKSWSQDLKNRAAHPHQIFSGIPSQTNSLAVDLWISLGKGIVFGDFFVRVT